MKSKVAAKPFWYHPLTSQQSPHKKGDDWVYFSSSLEFRVYLMLVSLLGKRWNVERQASILYKPETSNYKALTWKIDFRIVSARDSNRVYLIEAKGDWIYTDSTALAELQHKIQFLEFLSPQVWSSLVLVGDKKPRVLDNIQSFDFKEFTQWLKSL